MLIIYKSALWGTLRDMIGGTMRHVSMYPEYLLNSYFFQIMVRNRKATARSRPDNATVTEAVQAVIEKRKSLRTAATDAGWTR